MTVPTAVETLAILDVGKGHTKLLPVDVRGATVLRQCQRPSLPVASALGGQLDVAGIEQWLRTQLAAIPESERLQAIVPIAHSAAAVLLDRAGAVPDYDSALFE